MFVNKGGTGISVANYKSSSADAKELRGNLYAAAKNAIGGQVYIIRVRIFDSFGEDCFDVRIDPAPKLDSSVAPKFTAKQGQYLAFIYSYSKIHRRAPAEADLERYFQVSPPSIHEMIKLWSGMGSSRGLLGRLDRFGSRFDRSICRDWSNGERRRAGRRQDRLPHSVSICAACEEVRA